MASSSDRSGLTRGQLLHRGLTAGLALGAAGALPDVAMASAQPLQAPHLPAGFSRTFTSRFIKTGALRQHVVMGGDGPPLLLVHGWPQSWYQFRLLMPALARDFTVIAVDQRGMGDSDKPRDGYDPGTLANDLAALMDALGHERFAVLGCDTGMVIAYALAADHPGRVVRLAVGEAPLPGISQSPDLFLPGPAVSHVFHLLFNRLDQVNEQLVRGREEKFFGFVFDAEAGNKLPGYAVRHYIAGFASSRDALRGSFGFYRAWDTMTAQNKQRATHPLTMPVLAIGGALSSSNGVAKTMRATAADVHELVIPATGHFIAEEAPDVMLAALTSFLAPYRKP
jgi:pimeloyl-ACP methyl ester carboxylesterase